MEFLCQLDILWKMITHPTYILFVVYIIKCFDAKMFSFNSITITFREKFTQDHNENEIIKSIQFVTLPKWNKIPTNVSYLMFYTNILYRYSHIKHT